MRDRDNPLNAGRSECDRRTFLKGTAGICGAVGFAGLAGYLAGRNATDGSETPRAGFAESLVWQIDPEKCTACGRCATACVLDISAVRCYHNHKMCGYCRLCSGYFEPEPIALESGAENQLCPTGALLREFKEEPYYEYQVDKSLCIGCAKCVKGCTEFGNGSLYLQIDHSICVHCNQCAIATVCPAHAFQWVPASQAYILKGPDNTAP